MFIHKDPPPWIPAITQHTTAGMTDKAELHMVRAVNTGIINVKHTSFFLRYILLIRLQSFPWQFRSPMKRSGVKERKIPPKRKLLMIKIKNQNYKSK